jgi:hypothetical protein
VPAQTLVLSHQPLKRAWRARKHCLH